jgi:ABC-type sugar transport system permease subunit
MRRNNAWQFLALPLIIYTAIIIVPFFRSLFFSLTDWDGVSRSYDFVGLANFARVFTDPAFSASLWHNIVWTLIYLVLPTGLGLLLAIVLDKDIVGATVFKSIIYFPMIFSFVIVGMRELENSLAGRAEHRPPGHHRRRLLAAYRAVHGIVSSRIENCENRPY